MLSGPSLAVTPWIDTDVGVEVVMVDPPPENVAAPVPAIVVMQSVIGTGLVVALLLKVTGTNTDPPTVTAVSGPKVTCGATFPGASPEGYKFESGHPGNDSEHACATYTGSKYLVAAENPSNYYKNQRYGRHSSGITFSEVVEIIMITGKI